jgi:predicted metal-dependent hydrolase
VCQYNLIRADRKTVSLKITKDGNVEVRAPRSAAKTWIDEFVRSKEKWIEQRLVAVQERQEQREEFTVTYGSRLLWRGAEYPLIGETEGNRIWLDDAGFHLPAGRDADTLKYNVIRLYKIYAKPYLTERTLHFAKLMGVLPAAVKVTDAKTRWGSCSGKKSINFSWRLMMAEDDVIDAVVVHELAHIKEMNHSPAFWAIVESILPDYKQRQAKLKALQKKLAAEDWD